MAKRRANGEGSIYQRKSDGLWVGKLPIGRNLDGSIKFKVFYGKKQSEVKEKMDEAKVKISTGTFVDKNKITFGKWLEDWLNITMVEKIRDTTFLMYESLIRNHITPELGGIFLQELQINHLQKFYNDKLHNGRKDGQGGGLSIETMHRIHNIINASLNRAVKQKIIPLNVAQETELPKIGKKDKKSLSNDQQNKFLDFVQNSVKHKHYYVAYFLESCTGLRRGELLGLRWKDIDFNEQEIKVVQQLVRVGTKHIIREVKTEESQGRIISFEDNYELIKVLKSHKESEKAKFKLLGHEDETELAKMMKDGLAFTNVYGTYIMAQNFVKAFKQAVKDSGLEDMCFHEMRHSFATLSLQAEVDLDTLRGEMGHKHLSTTAKYLHANKEMKKAAAKKRNSLRLASN